MALEPIKQPPLIPQSPIVDLRTGAPTQFFIDWLNSLLSRFLDATNALIGAVNTLQTSSQASIQTQASQNQAAQQAAQAQASADQASGSAAKSGDASLTLLSAPGLSGWHAGPQVNLAGVVAGNLSVINTGPYQIQSTTLSHRDGFNGNWRVQEIVSGVETTVFNGSYTVERSRDDAGDVVIFYNNTDTTVLVPRASVGAVSYRLDLEAIAQAGIDLSSVQLYLYVRRS